MEEEIGELRRAIAANSIEAVREEMGDLHFTIVYLARFVATDADDALRGTIVKFKQRFSYIEESLRAAGKIRRRFLAEMDRLWGRAKGKG